MTDKPLVEQNFEFLSLKGSCTGLSECTLVKMAHCWRSLVTAQNIYLSLLLLPGVLQASPRPSWSVSDWSVLTVALQLSQASPTLSKSPSSWLGLAVKGQLSMASNIPIEAFIR